MKENESCVVSRALREPGLNPVSWIIILLLNLQVAGTGQRFLTGQKTAAVTYHEQRLGREDREREKAPTSEHSRMVMLATKALLNWTN